MSNKSCSGLISLIVAFICSIIVVAGCSTKSADSSDLSDISSESSKDYTDSNSEAFDSSNSSTSVIAEIDKFVINFIDDDIVLKRDEVSEIKQIQFPVISKGGAFFKQWSGLPYVIKENCDLLAEFDSIKDVNNAIGYDSIYIHSGDEFIVNIRISGQVDFCGLSLDIPLKNGLEFIGVTYADAYSVYHYNENTSIFKYEFVCNVNINADVDLISIKLKVNSETKPDKLNVIVNDCFKFNQDGNDLIDSDFKIFNEKIYII